MLGQYLAHFLKEKKASKQECCKFVYLQHFVYCFFPPMVTGSELWNKQLLLHALQVILCSLIEWSSLIYDVCLQVLITSICLCCKGTSWWKCVHQNIIILFCNMWQKTASLCLLFPCIWLSLWWAFYSR